MAMRVDLKDKDRRPLFGVHIDPARPPGVVRSPDATGDPVPLDWAHAWDDRHQLCRCPACGCRQLFARKDFPHGLGLAVVTATAIGATALFVAARVWWALAVLGVVALLDNFIDPLTKRCLVCYRCRSEYRGLPIRKDYPGWDLATGEKYRPMTDRAEETAT